MRLPALGVAAAAAALLAAPAAAAPISGRLSQPGYTVLALGASGQTATAIARDGTFSLEPPAETVTLHLRAPDGSYAGPVVLQESGNALAVAAQQAVAQAQRRLRRAKRKVRAARRALRRARGQQARRRASRRLRVARRRTGRARRRLVTAGLQLREAQRLDAERPTRALLGVKSGAALGDVAIDAAAGYALARGLAPAFIDLQRTAQAVSGVPIGAGNFGRVLSQRTDGGAIGDVDRDGIPGALDIDDDGDLILDSLDSASPVARAAQANPSPFGFFTRLTLTLSQTANANHPALDDNLATALAGPENGGALLVTIVPGASAELDCGGAIQDPPREEGLLYCRTGGTGRAWMSDPARGPGPFAFPSFPDCCDLDGDGFGTLVRSPGDPGAAMTLTHGATSADIKTGDVMIEHVTREGPESQCPDSFNPACASYSNTLQYVFATVPALKSFSDGVSPPVTVDYPVRGHVEGGPDPGVGGNGFIVDPRPPGDPDAGDVVLTLTFWRPQRSRIEADPPAGPGESPAWTDIGRLNYNVGVDNVGAFCPASAFSGLSETLAPPVVAPTFPGAGGVSDTAADQPANPARTLTFTLNVTECLAARGRPSLQPGEDRNLDLAAMAPRSVDQAMQAISFRLRGGRITVRKQTNPPDPGAPFEFRPDAALGPNFQLRHDGTKSYELRPGTYVIEEVAAPASHQLTGVTCDDSDSTGSVADRTATFVVALREHVTCTFTSEPTP